MLTQKILEQQKAQAKTGIATWYEESYWMAPDEITGGVNGFYLLDPRPLDQPDIPYEQYKAEMDRSIPEFAHGGWHDSYRVSCALRRYVAPTPKLKAKTVVPVDAPEQADLEIE